MKILAIVMIQITLIACAQYPRADSFERQLGPLIAWNQKILEIAEAEDKFLTLKGLRTLTMAHIAMHDAINTKVDQYRHYLYNDTHPGANHWVAMIEAAYVVATTQYPDQQIVWLAEKNRWLEQIADGAGKTKGLVMGQLIAQSILTNRKSDNWDQESHYQWHPMAPGVYAEFNRHSGTPEGFIFGAGWGSVMPFALSSYDQFIVVAPPKITSQEYSQAFDEVKELGRLRSDSRTEDQSHLALWWKDFAENSHNRLARSLITNSELSLAQAARLLALMNMAIFDGYINVFYNKFYHNHWRPYTAIRWAANDGNPNTEAEPEWTNTHRHTYAFPSYPSAHGTVCAAAMTVLADTFGNNFAFDMLTESVDSRGPFSEKMAMVPPVRYFDSFSQAALECAMSRVYLGIHFRYDSIQGNELGKQIGNHILRGYLQPKHR